MHYKLLQSTSPVLQSTTILYSTLRFSTILVSTSLYSSILLSAILYLIFSLTF